MSHISEEDMVEYPAPLPEGIVAATPEAVVIEGGPATGKTQRLVERAAQLVEGGADPAQLLVLCATPDAARCFAERLSARCAAAAAVKVTTPREWSLDFLAIPQVQAALGRDSRLLTPYEYDILLEDLKVQGIRASRLREMLKFFYRTMTELSDWDEEWLLTGEEIEVHGIMQDSLYFQCAYIEPEISNTAARYLRDNPEIAQRFAVQHVLVDDYQMLSRASQVLANRLAAQSIVVSTDPQAVVEVYDSYPYAKGIDEFVEANPQAEHVTLTNSWACAAAVRAANALSAKLGLEQEICEAEGVSQQAFVHIEADTPAAEMTELAAVVESAIADGLAPEDIVVASPNGVWTHNAAKALEAHGIPCEVAHASRELSGDIRDLNRCKAARVFTALCLVANPHDGAAWRAWCAFGDPFGNSLAMKALRAYGTDHLMAIDAVLEAFDPDEVLVDGVHVAAMQQIKDAYEQMCSLRAGAEGRKGRELVDYLAMAVLGESAPATVVRLTAPFANGVYDGTDAASMVKRAQRRLTGACFERRGAVRVAPYGRVAGMSPAMLLFAGFVNGLFPSKAVLDREMMAQQDAEKQEAKDTRLLRLAASKPTRVLGASIFKRADLEVAERQKMKISRIVLDGGKRVARVMPSNYLAVIDA